MLHSLQGLRMVGLRPTSARVGVLQVIEGSGMDRISAEDVFRQMTRRGTQASVSTVYRVIHELAGRGLLLREWDARRKALYRRVPDHFDEKSLCLVCLDSGRSVILADAHLYEGLVAAARHQGIDLDGQALSVQGSTVGARRRAGARLSSVHSHLVALMA